MNGAAGTPNDLDYVRMQIANVEALLEQEGKFLMEWPEYSVPEFDLRPGLEESLKILKARLVQVN